MSDTMRLGLAPEPDPGERVPPHDALAEQSALGGAMLSKNALWDVLETLDARDYYLPKHELIHEAIMALVARSEPVDVITVSAELARTKQLANAGGDVYLHQLTGVVPTAANAGYYAEMVRNKAIMRRLVEAGTRITQMGYASEGSPVDLAESARAELDAAAQNSQQDLHSIGTVFGNVVDELAAPPKYVETPWREINDLIGGLRPGGLYVWAARPGEGKTIAGLQLAAQLALSGPVAFCSLEMSEGELMKRLIAMKGRIHLSSIGHHRLSDDDKNKLVGIRNAVLAMPLFVDDRSGVTITQIKAHARSVARKGPIRGVVIDYMQLISSTSRDRARHEVVREISQQLKVLARELNCPVIALAQLNRESVKQRRAPQLSDLAESAAIEQDADVVVLLQRQRDRDDVVTDQLNVYVAKSRQGPQGFRTLLWEGQYARLGSNGIPGMPPLIEPS